MINLFQLRGGHLLADLPGYGYAKTPKSTQNLWRKNIARFLQNPKIGCVVLVADARRGLGDNDFALLQLVRHSPALVLLNKADKLNRADIRKQTQNTLAQLGGESAKNAVIPFSATQKTGADETRKNLAKLMNPPANSQ